MDIHGGNPKAISARYGISLRDELIDFSANINPIGPPDGVIRVLSNPIKDLICRYPDPEVTILRMELAKFHDLPHDNILVGNGSTELIYLLPKALKPKSVLIIDPSFSEYRQALHGFDCRVGSITLSPEEDFRLKTNVIESELKKEYDLVFIGNPSNPTGTLLLRNEMTEFLDMVSYNETMIVVDEAFIDFYDEGESVIDLAFQRKGILVLRSMTKFFSLAGLRIGYASGSKGIIDKIKEYQNPWSINAMAERAGVEALRDSPFIVKTRRWLGEERSFLFNNLKDIKGLYPYPSKTNFILTRIEGMTSIELQRRLFKKGFLIRECCSFKGLGEGFFRVAVLTRRENTALIKAIKSVLA